MLFIKLPTPVPCTTIIGCSFKLLLDHTGPFNIITDLKDTAKVDPDRIAVLDLEILPNNLTSTDGFFLATATTHHH